MAIVTGRNARTVVDLGGLDKIPGLRVSGLYGAEAAVCYVGEWGAEVPALADSDGSRMLYCAVARRP